MCYTTCNYSYLYPYKEYSAVTTNGNGTWVSSINNSTLKINDPLQCPMLWKDSD